MLIYEIRLNGEDITDNVSIGATIREKLAEPMDDGSIHLPLSFIDIEYEMKGLLEISIEEGNITKGYEFLIIDDNTSEGSKYGEYKHDLTVMEYSGKYDDYIISSFASTKIIKDEGLAPFTYNSYNLNRPTTPEGDTFGFIQNLYLPPIKVNRIYYIDEPIIINKVEEAFQMLDIVNILSATYKRTPVFLKAVKDGEDEQRVVLSDSASNFILNKGEWTLQYGIYNTVDYQIGDIEVPLDEDVAFYEYHIRVIDRKDISIYDLLQQISDMKSKFGGVESRSFYYETRLFEIDEDIVDYLKSVEAPQMYFQKMTVRQALNIVFSYVNAISRFKRNNSGHLDTLTMDEFNKITGIFDLDEGVSNYSSQRSGSELALKGISFLERAMPNDLGEPTIETPANDMFKTVRAIDIQMTENSFELKLERPIYQPKKLEALLKNVLISYQTTSNPNSKDVYSEEDIILDLTHRWINIEEWRLKEITTNFPNIHLEYMYSQNVGLAKNMTENLYWQDGDTSIKMSDLFGQIWESILIVNVIKSVFMEYFTRVPLRPYLYNDGYDDLMATYYEVEFNLPNWANGLRDKLLFNVEYISLEDIVVDFDRKDLTDNYNYYSEAKVNQTDKLIAVGLATRGMSGDIQRSGTRDLVVSQYHNKLDEVLKVGMYNPKHRLTITELKLNLQNEFIGATYMLSKDFNRAQMFRTLMQEYRWSEIPTSRQIHDRHELYKDYLMVERPDKNEILSEITKIRGGTAKIIFDILNDSEYIENTKITYAFVRTDGSNGLYDGGGLRSAIYSPVSSFGIKDGLSFSFGFDSNLIAGDGLKLIDSSYYNNAIRYTDLDGRFTKLWFSLKQNHETVTDVTELRNYPLLLVDVEEFEDEVQGLIDSGSPDFNNSNSDYLIWKKDSRQNAKLSYQISVLPEEHNLYVFGQPFFSNNYLAKNRNGNGTEKYLYIYNNVEDYEYLRYGIFDDLKIKGGYDEENVIKIDVTNSIIFYEGDKLKFRITNSDILSLIDEATHWAIGDIQENLYLACNENLYGFDVIAQHIKHDVKEIGGYRHKYKTILKLETSVNAYLEISHGLILTGSFSEEIRVNAGVSSDFIEVRNLATELRIEENSLHGLILSKAFNEEIRVGVEVGSSPIIKIDIYTKLLVVEETDMSLILSRSFNEFVTIISSFEAEIIGAIHLQTYLTVKDSSVHSLILSKAFNEEIALNAGIEKGADKIKPDPPDPPTAYSISPTSITLEAIENGMYKMDDGDWQYGETFSPLEVNSQHLFYQKTVETDTHLESDSSLGASITTAKYTQDKAPIPTLGSTTSSMIILVAKTNPANGVSAEYRVGSSGSWSDSTNLSKDGNGINLQPNTTYSVYQRYKETSTYKAGDVSNPLQNVKTDRGSQSAPEAPSYTSRTAIQIVLKSISSNPTTGADVQYRLGAGSWTYNNTFSGLNANTNYTFYARYEETTDYYAGSTSSASIKTLSKETQTAPNPPTEAGKAQTSITLVDMGDTIEYRMDGGSWTSNTMFTGLTAGSTHTFEARKKETPTHNASPPSSPPTSITTTKFSQTAPSSGPTKSSVTHNSITVVGITNGEYSIGGVNWQSSTELTKDGSGNNLQPNASYTVYQRYAETPTHNASPSSSGTSISTIKITQSPPPAPSLEEAGPNWIELEPIQTPPSGAGVQYKILGGLWDWQDSPYFSSGLYPNTQYSFVARYKETATHSQSSQSVNSNFTTLKYTNPYTPPTPVATNITHNSIIIQAVSGCEYSINGVNWSGSTTFSGLVSSTNYTIYQRYYETSDTYASNYSSNSFTTSPTPPPPVTVTPSINGIYAYLEGGPYRIYADITNNDNVTVTVYINNVNRGTISGYGSSELRFGVSTTNPHGESRTITVTAQASGKDMSSGTTETMTVVLKL